MRFLDSDIGGEDGVNARLVAFTLFFEPVKDFLVKPQGDGNLFIGHDKFGVFPEVVIEFRNVTGVN